MAFHLLSPNIYKTQHFGWRRIHNFSIAYWRLSLTDSHITIEFATSAWATTTRERNARGLHTLSCRGWIFHAPRGASARGVGKRRRSIDLFPSLSLGAEGARGALRQVFYELCAGCCSFSSDAPENPKALCEQERERESAGVRLLGV
jgi:hypothetical protein